MTARPHLASVSLAAVALLIVVALAVGLYRGELVLPAKGFQHLVQRAANPLGFYALAAFYAALAGICGYLLWMVVRAQSPRAHHSQRSAPMPTPTPTPTDGSLIDLKRSVVIEQSGRSGRVVVNLSSGSHAFSWEFGGGSCIAIIDVPSDAQWRANRVLAEFPRQDFLHALARAVGRAQCPGARYLIGKHAIEFHQD